MRVVAVKRLAEPCQPALTTYCPTMNLVATVNDKQSVDVWRKNGQRVFGLPASEDESRTIESLAWKADGHLLAVAASDGVVSVIDSFSGKIGHKFRVREGEVASLPNWSSSQDSAKGKKRRGLTLWWTSHFANAPQVTAQLNGDCSSTKLDELLGLYADIPKLLGATADLPRELANIDIETSLPKLSTLPATGADDDVFSSRNSIDTIFHARNTAPGHRISSDDIVDVLLTDVGDASLHVRIFDSFEVGTIDLSKALPKGLQLRQILKCAGHPLSSKIYTLVEAESDPSSLRKGQADNDGLSLHLLEIDLRFIPQTGYNLPLLASKATQLQNLLRYLLQISNQLSQEIRTAFDLPSRFLRNVNESLAEHGSGASFATVAYHLVVTGQCDPRFKEWLVDEVGERGLKRWEKAVGDCLDLIRRMTSECLLPAIERCQVVLSRLDGLARFGDTANKLGLDEKLIRAVRETLDVLNILCEDLLSDVCIDIREFAAFMRWIKWEAEVEALEEVSERAEEMRESFGGESELKTVLDYITGSMEKSRVLRYINAEKEAAPSSASENGDSAQYYANYKQMRSYKNDSTELPKLSSVLHRLQTQTQDVFGHIAETLKKSMLCSYVAEVPERIDESMLDMRVVRAGERDQMDIHVLSRSYVSTTLLYFTVSAISGAKDTAFEVRQHKRKVSGRVLDVKFVGEESLLMLASSDADKTISQASTWKHTVTAPTLTHIFEGGQMEGGMKPASLVVSGRNEKTAVAVLDEGRMGYVSFQLDKAEDSKRQ